MISQNPRQLSAKILNRRGDKKRVGVAGHDRNVYLFDTEESSQCVF